MHWSIEPSALSSLIILSLPSFIFVLGIVRIATVKNLASTALNILPSIFGASFVALWIAYLTIKMGIPARQLDIGLLFTSIAMGAILGGLIGLAINPHAKEIPDKISIKTYAILMAIFWIAADIILFSVSIIFAIE